MRDKDNICSKDFQFLRGLYLKNITDNLGSVVVFDDRIICHVDNKKLKRKIIKNSCRIFLPGTDQLDCGKLNLYDVNKPVCYVIDGMRFDMDIVISTARNASVIFRECWFTKSIGLRNANEIIFENNLYYNNNNQYVMGDCFLCGRNINTLKFINDNFQNLNERNSSTKFNLDVKTSNLEIIDSKISTDFGGYVNLVTEKTKILNSHICASNVYIKSEDLKQQEFTISANAWEIDNYSDSKRYDGVQKKLKRNK